MRLWIGMATAVALSALPSPGGISPNAARAQQIEQQPLPAPAPLQPQSQSPSQSRSPAASPSPSSGPADKQVVQLMQDSDSHLSTQDCVRMPSAVDITDCLNRVSQDGQYSPSPKPAPSANMPMAYRLPLGKRELAPPP